MKKSLRVTFLLVLLSLLAPFVPRASFAQQAVEVFFFYSPTCPHCAQEKVFLDNLEKQHPEVSVKRYNASGYTSYLEEFYQAYNVPRDVWGWVPITFVSEKYFLGFDSGIGEAIEAYVSGLIESIGSQPEGEAGASDGPGGITLPAPEEEPLRLPIFGEVDISKTGPLAFSALVGIVDGFNACAMWALCFLLTLLVASGSRKRIFLVGGTFILVSGLVYLLFIATWLNLFLVIGHLKAVQAAISALAIIFGLVCIKDFFAFGKGVTFILPKVMREKIGERMVAVTDPGLTLSATLAGVAFLAAGVNAVELLCTSGFPAVFTKILSAYSLPRLTYYLCLLVYIFFYMLDDLFVFSAVTLTLGAREFPDRYKRLSKLISGTLILILGLIMLIRPELLLFGG